MKIIRQTPNPSGAYPGLQDWNSPVIPEDMAVWPDALSTDIFYDYNGFVHLTFEQVNGVDTVMTCAPNAEVWSTWKENLPAEPDPEPTAQDDTDSMVVDHEYRLMLLELGVTEEV